MVILLLMKNLLMKFWNWILKLWNGSWFLTWNLQEVFTELVRYQWALLQNIVYKSTVFCFWKLAFLKLFPQINWLHFIRLLDILDIYIESQQKFDFFSYDDTPNFSVLTVLHCTHGNHIGMANLSLVWYVSMCVSQSYLCNQSGA